MDHDVPTLTAPRQPPVDNSPDYRRDTHSTQLPRHPDMHPRNLDRPEASTGFWTSLTMSESRGNQDDLACQSGAVLGRQTADIAVVCLQNVGSLNVSHLRRIFAASDCCCEHRPNLVHSSATHHYQKMHSVNPGPLRAVLTTESTRTSRT